MEWFVFLKHFDQLKPETPLWEIKQINSNKFLCKKKVMYLKGQVYLCLNIFIKKKIYKKIKIIVFYG